MSLNASSEESDNQSAHNEPVSAGSWLSWVVLITALAITLVVWRWLVDLENNHLRTQFDKRIEEARALLLNQFEGYETILKGAAALFKASHYVTREEWHDYVTALQLEKNYPAFVALTYARAFTQAERSGFEAEMLKSGYRDVVIWPAGERDRYATIVYVEPSTPRNIKAIGYDMWQEPNRQATLAKALTSGQPAITQKLTLVVDDSGSAVTAFIMYLPVYDRQGKLLGFVLSPFRIAALADALLTHALQGIAFTIYDGTETKDDAVIFRNQHEGAQDHAHVLRHVETLNVAGRAWTLELYGEPSLLKAVGYRNANWVPIIGLFISVLLFLLIRTMLATRRQAMAYAAEMTASLRQSEENLRSYIENAPDGIFITDLSGRYVEVNPAGCRMVGYARHELRNMSITDLSPPGVAADHDALFNTVKLQGMLDMGIQLRRKDGSEFPADLHAVLLPRQRVMGFCRDVTERKQTEAVLQRYREDLEATVDARTAELRKANQQLNDTLFAMDSVGIAIYWAETDTGCLRYVNRHAASMLGYTPEEMLKLRVSDIDPSFTDERYRQISEDIRNNLYLRFETQQRRKDGSILLVEMTVYAHTDENGVTERFIGFGVDITQRKAAEQALIDAKQAAEAANVAKSAFLANMSHEIRTPLNAMTGMAHLIRRDGLTPRQMERLDKLEAAGVHLLEIINAILDLSKIEAGKFELLEAPVHIGNLFGNIASMLQDRLKEKGIAIRTEIVPLPPLLGDATRLQQAVLNYASNALKFTEKGEVVMRVLLLTEDADTAMLRFEVQDTGIGLDPNVIPRLFTAFEQVDNTTTRQYGGTGLGLAITRKIAQLMEGDAGVVSIPGAGSTFWFTARLKKSDEQIPEAKDSSVVSADDLRRVCAGASILLVEDDPVNREIALVLLENVGLAVDLAEDGVVAVAKARENTYDTILMDMQMPNLDGLQATRQIRQLPQHTRTPIIALTANAFAEDRARCMAAGMDDFLAKPINFNSLYAILLRWLSHPG